MFNSAVGKDATTTDEYYAWCNLFACFQFNPDSKAWCAGEGGKACRNQCAATPDSPGGINGVCTRFGGMQADAPCLMASSPSPLSVLAETEVEPTHSIADQGLGPFSPPWNDEPEETTDWDAWCLYEKREGCYACENVKGAGKFCRGMCAKMGCPGFGQVGVQMYGEYVAVERFD